MGLSYYIITHFAIGLVAIALGSSVFLKDKKNSVNQTFGLFTFGVAAWSIFYGIWLLAKTPQTALFWSRMLNLGATFIPVFLLHWITRLLKKKKRKVLIAFYLFTALFAVFSFSGYYIKGTKHILQFLYWPQMGWLYAIFLILGWGGAGIYSLILLSKELKRAKGYYREQIKYVFLGLVIGYLGGSTNYPLMVGFDWLPPVGSPFVIAFPVLFSYAMVKYRLMDIKFVLRKYSVYLVTIATIVIPALTLKYFAYILLPRFDILIDFIILLAAMTTFPTLIKYYYNLATKYFFSSLYDDRQVIAKLSDRLSSTLDINKIYKYIGSAIINSFHAKTASILLFNIRKKKYSVEFDIGHKKGSRKSFIEDKGFYSNIIKKNRVIVVEELNDKHYKEYKRTINFLDKYGIEILVPLRIKQRVLGVIALGPKESRDMYNDEDIRVLGIIGTQSAIALENALLFEETKKFSIKLEREVKQATKELREANEKLKKLDQAKSEFISIASHQLRTPLTVVKGYISMMLEGSFGDMATQRRVPLEKVYESNERLIQLVENLLNISRIESGRLRFSFEQMRFEELVTGVVDELKGPAKKKGLELVFDKPDKPLHKIKIDEEKIRQVVLNLIDNAIKYSIKGVVKAGVEEQDKEIQFSVSDKGMGIRREDLSSLFKKFSRGTDTPLINPGGTGLGLYVARIMVEAHKGKIWAESDGPGKGSRFCFTIPIK